MILQQMELIISTDVVRNLCKKMAPPLVTLLSSEPEIQYVALRNINLIVQRRPTILAHEIKVKRHSPSDDMKCTNLAMENSYLCFMFGHILIKHRSLKMSFVFRCSSANTMIQFM